MSEDHSRYREIPKSNNIPTSFGGNDNETTTSDIENLYSTV